jgi:hypothetical protein
MDPVSETFSYFQNTGRWTKSKNPVILITDSVKQNTEILANIISSKTLHYDIKNGGNNVILNDWNDELVIKELLD